MKNITHPLERLKLIADETIRKQAIENFDENHYREYRVLDSGSIADAIYNSFVWNSTPQEHRYWQKIHTKALNNQLELLPEEPSELEKVKLENEKLRECLGYCLQMLEQTKIHREKYNVKGGDVFLDTTITQAKQLLNQK